jgi:pimeloyl-ACP methyl ester carboxylesterase
LSAFTTASVGCSDDDKKAPSDEPNTLPNEMLPDAGGGAGGARGSDETGNAGGTDPRPALPGELTLPIVFVHGFAGSAQQFDSQAMRFVANGFPAERLFAYEHDGAGFAIETFVTELDAYIDDVREKFSTDKVYVIGHSRGTSVSSMYLGDPARAAKVAKYIALDGAGCANVPIPCIAPAQTTNMRAGQTDPLPGHKHVEVATSKVSFGLQYAFLFDRKPEVVDIVKQRAPVVISGRAVNFPANTGREGARLDVWKIDNDTGLRIDNDVRATFDVDPNGNWGPFTVDPDSHYEFVLSTDADSGQHHFYMQRFLRSSAFVRLLSGPPTSDARLNSHITDYQTNLTVSRMREWTTDDALTVEIRSENGDQEARNVISEATRSDRIAIYLQDDEATPKETTLNLLPWFPDQPFQTGVDLYLPASAEKPNGTITLTNEPRGDSDSPQVVHVPNWAASQHTVSVLFSDYPQP